MKMNKPLAVLALSLLGAACGGTVADISGTGFKSAVIGEIESLDSLVVNGTRYLTDDLTVIELDGAPARLSSLQLGMVVELEVDAADLGLDGALARRVAFRSTAHGPIELIDVEAGWVEVLGQRLSIDDRTRIVDVDGSSLSFDALAVGEVIRVSGYRLDDGLYRASLLARLPVPEDLVVHGTVSGLERDSMHFQLGALRVNYAQAASTGQLGEDLRDGDVVRVNGVRTGANALAARRVEELNLSRPLDQRVSAQGEIGRISAAASCPLRRFELNGQAIALNRDTALDGTSCAELAAGQSVVVMALREASGELSAQSLRVLPRPSSSVRAEIETVSLRADARNCRFEVLGGLIVEVGRDTRRDQPPRDSTSLAASAGCDELQQGQSVQLVGQFDLTAAGGVLRALRLALASADQGQALAGEVQALDSGARQLRLLNITVQLADDTQYSSGDEASFYAQTAVGDSLQILGRWDGQQLQARSVRSAQARSLDQRPAPN